MREKNFCGFLFEWFCNISSELRMLRKKGKKVHNVKAQQPTTDCIFHFKDQKNGITMLKVQGNLSAIQTFSQFASMSSHDLLTKKKPCHYWSLFKFNNKFSSKIKFTVVGRS